MNAEQFLNTEQAAEELVTTLEKLRAEVQSFGSATQELAATRKKLEGFIDSCREIAADTNAIVKEIRKIGGPELFSRMDQLESVINARARKLQVLVVIVGVISFAAAIASLIPLVR